MRPLPSIRPRRPIGGTGFLATQIGAGDLADRSVERERCVATLRRALDAGVNVVDTAPGYEDGYSEEIVGEALRGRREGVFVIDKIDHLERPVGPQLDASLARLGLPGVDLLVFHALSDLATFRRLAAQGGGFAELAEEIARGRARFRGISSHHPDVLAAALDAGLCDVLLFPVGPFCHPRYVDEILPRARALGVGTICFKTFGAGKLLGDTEGYGRALSARPRGKLSSGGSEVSSPNGGSEVAAPEGGSVVAAPALPRLSVPDCLRYTLTCDPDVALLGLSFPNEQDAAFAALQDHRPMSTEELSRTRTRATEAMAGKGQAWWNPPEPAPA
jgi:aryl-alcohol dehydrogenase-like predicted oxidoreductase